jgi:hypothetical protein
LISKVFKKNSNEKNLSKDDQIETEMQVYKDFRNKITSRKGRKKNEEKN